MANTTFSGPVRSENGFETIVKNATTGAITKVADINGQTGGNSVVADAAKEAGALLLNSIATTGFSNENLPSNCCRLLMVQQLVMKQLLVFHQTLFQCFV